MPSFNVPLPEQQNAGGSAIAGIKAGQELALNQVQMLAYQEQMRQRQLENERAVATQALAKAAAAGDANSLAQLSAIAPDAAKGIRDYNNYKIARTGQIFQTVTTAPKSYRAQALQQAIDIYKNEFGETPPTPGLGPYGKEGYSDQTHAYLQGLVTQSRDVEKVAAEEFERPLQQAKLGTEYAQQGKIKADTAKTYEELTVSRQEREAAKNMGLSLDAYKQVQKGLGEAKSAEVLAAQGITPKLSGEGAKVLTIAEDGLTSIKSMEDLLYSKGQLKSSAGKTIGGATFLPSILQGEDQQQFDTVKNNLSDLIGRLRSGGAINKDEESRFLKLMPKYGDKASTIEFKLKQLNNNFAKLKEGLTGVKMNVSGGGGNDPLGIR